MDKKDEALKMAIKALLTGHHHTDLCNEAVNACKEALEQPACPECGGNGAGGEHEEDCSKLQPAQKPVEYLGALANVDGSVNLYFKKDQWQGLTDDEILQMKAKGELGSWFEIARAIEAKLKEKNYG